MGAARKYIDKKVLRDLVPLNALSALHLDEISKKALIEDVRTGRYIFKAGDSDNNSVYLLEGTLELLNSDREVVDTIVAGSDTARHPLAHKQPRHLSARASGTVTVARIDSSLLDVLLTWDESAGYDVVEIDAEDDDDWMTRMLQSQAFMQLPPSNIHQLLMRLESVSASAGEVIVTQGEDGEYFYIVKNGRLAVTRKVSARGKEVLLAELSEGACFGEEALVAGTRRNASVMMVTDGTLMRLSKDDFDQLLREPLVHEVDFGRATELVATGARWLDVRLPGEFENRSVRGSHNFPLSALRDQINSLDADATYILCCDTGRRSSAGAFILSQRGFNVYYLSNGLMEVPDEELVSQQTRDSAAAANQDAEIIRLDAGQEGSADVDAAAAGSEPTETGSLSADALEDEVRLLRDSLRSRDLDIRALEQQLEEAQMAVGAVAGQDQGGEREALEQTRKELEQLKSRQDTDSGKSDSRISSLTDQLEQRNASLLAGETRIKALEQQLAEQISLADALHQEIEIINTGLGQARSDTARTEQQLQERAQQIEQAQQRESALQLELEETKRKNSELALKLDDHDEISHQSGEWKARFEEAEKKLAEQINAAEVLQNQLTSVQQKSQAAEGRVATLEKKLLEIGKEHKSEISSVHDAMARVQTERENIFREQNRLAKELNRVKRELVHEQNDHKDTVHRMRKELEAAAVEDNSALADELKEAQGQYRQEQEERAALEQQLLVQAKEASSLQAALDAANEQLEKARESAEQAGQQLDDAVQRTSEELNARLAGEQQVQQTLREEIAAVVSQRDEGQERLTVMEQELADLRAAAETFRQEKAENEQQLQSLQQLEARQQSAIQEHEQHIQELEQDRDEARRAEQRAREEIDQYRAEAEITRGLVGAQASSADADPQLRQELEQIRKNVDVAVRLRNQAEEELAETRQELHDLRAELESMQSADAYNLEASEIPSLDEDDPYESVLSAGGEGDAAGALQARVADQETTPQVLLDDDEISDLARPASESGQGSSRSGGKILAGLFMLVAVAGGAFWWYGQNEGVKLPSGFLSDTEEDVAVAGQGVVFDEPVAVEQVEPEPEAVVEETLPDYQSAGEKTGDELPVASGKERNPDVEPFSMAKGMMPVEIPDYSSAAPEDANIEVVSSVEEESAEPSLLPVVAEPVAINQPARRFSDVLADGGTAPGMIQLHADRFVMGSGPTSPNFDERPEHAVQLGSFAISRYEVTFDDYDRFAQATGRSLPYDEGWGRGRRPVINVSWQDARAYSRWLSEQTGYSYRLPTEAEWEYAARSGSSRMFSWGGEFQEDLANCYDCGDLSADGNTRPVGSYAANNYGLHDMPGNVREWTQDCYRPGYRGAPRDGRAVTASDCVEYSVRGGSFSLPSDKLRSASRDKAPARSRLDDLGFRVVRE